MPRSVLTLALLVVVAAPAHGDPVNLRVATIAPNGTGWAREFGAWARDIEAGTHGAVHLKMYYAGIGGDDFAVLQRIERDQLDGAISSETCLRLAPSLRVTRVFGLFQSREEAAHVLGRLKSVLDAEFLKAGFISLGVATLGPEMLFTRQPVRDLAELRNTKLWIWDLDPALRLQAQAFGLKVVPSSLESASRVYDEKSVDGFIAIPSAALAFQWSAQAGYLQDINLAYRNGCLFFSSRSFDALPIDVQRYIRAASAKLRKRLDDMEKLQNDALMGGLFARQGLKAVPVAERVRLEFLREARELRSRVGGQLVPQKLLEQVLQWLADYRVEHPLSN